MAKKQITYDRNTPGKLLGHKPDDCHRAWAAVTRKPCADWEDCVETFRGADCVKLAQSFVRKNRKVDGLVLVSTTVADVHRDKAEHIARVHFKRRKECRPS
jgi:hypothetical protein